MASYGALIQSIKTAEINRVNREGNFTRWAYFVDEVTGKAGIICANDTHFAAFSAEEEPDPKLHQFGLELIKDLVLTPDRQYLLLRAGDNLFQVVLFNDPLMVDGDDFSPQLTMEMMHEKSKDWQRFLARRGVQREAAAGGARYDKRLVIGIGVAVALAGGWILTR